LPRNVGEPILTDEKRAEYQRHVDELPVAMPSLDQRAAAADRHWTDKIEALQGPDSTHSFRGLYAIAYRRQSALDHATLMGLNPVTVDLPDDRTRIQLEWRNPEMHGPFGLAVILFTFTLFISAATLDWPAADDVERAFE
jgi:hypothetical protein